MFFLSSTRKQARHTAPEPPHLPLTGYIVVDTFSTVGLIAKTCAYRTLVAVYPAKSGLKFDKVWLLLILATNRTKRGGFTTLSLEPLRLAYLALP